MERISQLYKRLANIRPAGFWPGFVFGIFYFFYIFWWFWSVYPLVLLGTNSNNLAFLIILLPFIITVTGMSFFWGTFSYIIHNFSGKASRVFLPLFYAGAFVLLEYLRTWFFGILWAGKSSLLGAHWTLGSPAYLFANLGPIRQSASYWGIYGVDFFIIFIGCILFFLARPRSKDPKKILCLEILSIVVILVFFNLSTSSDKPETIDAKLTISVIQTAKPIKLLDSPEELLTDFSEKNKLLREASKISDVVVFPESADFSKIISGFLDPASAQKYFASLSPKNILVVDSNRISETEGLKSKVLFINSKEGVIDSYDKKLLTPGGESLPYLASFPLWLFEHFFKNNFISSSASFAKGVGDNVLNYKDSKIKLVVCSDVISPGISREGKFDFMLNLENLAVFDGSLVMEQELLSMARFRATENGKYLAISSNFGHSFIIDTSGNVVDSTNSTGYQILTGDIVPNQTRTWYNKLGDWPILLASLVILGLGLISSELTRLAYYEAR